MAKKQETAEKKLEGQKYPCYLSNRPGGNDLFEGRSQEKLAQTIASHIIEADNLENRDFSRIIGLEGKWGSGKSNVIKILEDNCKNNNYTFFYFDAWGNQEDLQRRSILELLTQYLISKNKLTGKTTMRMMKPDGQVYDNECNWQEKLESLLSRKSYSRKITVPSLNNATKWFVLALIAMEFIVSYLDVDNTCRWWIDIIIALSPLLAFAAWMIIARQSWSKMFAMYNTEGRSDTTSYVISEQEPSVHEFKQWMNEVSKGLKEGEKLVLVFDNMDRLTSEKVHQFWSLIQTFFADDGYENIWCIVPYDESHLASVFSDEENEDKSIKLLRRYLDKTFPVIFRVPEPIVADYKKIFEDLFRKAFGPAIDNDSLLLISQCYRLANPVPNVREIISFINRNVLLAKQWNETINAVSRAVYVLKEDAILRNPKVTLDGQEGEGTKDASTEEYILANEYYHDFAQILMGEVNLPTMQQDISALVYGISPDKANQIVIKRFIRNIISSEVNDASIKKYSDNPQFILLLQEEVRAMSVVEYEKAVLHIDEIESSKLRPEDQKRLDDIWRYIGRRYKLIDGVAIEYRPYERVLFSHLNVEQAKQCVTNLCTRLIDNEQVTGTVLYEQLNDIFCDDFAKTFDVAIVCPSVTLQAKRYVDFVKQAGADYKRFPLKANKEELNKAIEEDIGSPNFINTIILLRKDSDYAVSEMGKYAVNQLKLEKSNAERAANLIAVQRVFYDKLQCELNTGYVDALWRSAGGGDPNDAYYEIYALKAAYGSNEQLPEDSSHIDALMEKIPFYSTTTQLLIKYLANQNVSYRRNLLKRMLTEKRHDSTPDYPEFIEKWQMLVNGLGVTREEMVWFADNWGYKEIPEQEKAKSYFALLPDVTWIDILLNEKMPLTKALLDKCVSEMSEQGITQFLQINSVIHANTNWNIALKKLVDTNYISITKFRQMPNIAASLLEHAAKYGPITDVTWCKLLKKVKYSNISSNVHNLRNNILLGSSGYDMTPAKFLFLYEWLEPSEINIELHWTDTANKILAKVVDDAQCQNVIMKNKDYYKPIITNTVNTASALHNKLKKILETQGTSDFAAYIRECVDYGVAEKEDE